jgi:integrase
VDGHGADEQPHQKLKLLTVLNGVFVRARRAYKLGYNPMADVEKPRQRSSTAIEVFAPEEVWALVRAADSEQDAAIFLTAAFTGLRRGELVALRWRDIAFTAQRVRVCGSFAGGRLTTPKSGKVRSVPMAPDVARALARLARVLDRRRRPGLPGRRRLVPRRLGAVTPLQGGAPARRPTTAPVPRLSHTFGTRVIANADIRRVQEWMGHADVATTMKYLHYVERPDEAELVAAAFAVESPASRPRSPQCTRTVGPP